MLHPNAVQHMALAAPERQPRLRGGGNRKVAGSVAVHVCICARACKCARARVRVGSCTRAPQRQLQRAAAAPLARRNARPRESAQLRTQPPAGACLGHNGPAPPCCRWLRRRAAGIGTGVGGRLEVARRLGRAISRVESGADTRIRTEDLLFTKSAEQRLRVCHPSAGVHRLGCKPGCTSARSPG